MSGSALTYPRYANTACPSWNTSVAHSMVILSCPTARNRPEQLPQNNLGVIELKQQRWTLAERRFKNALRVSGDYYEALNNLGLLYLCNAKEKRAIIYLKECMRLQPAAGSHHWLLGNAYQKLGRIPEAITEYKCALDFSPSDLRVLTRLAMIYATSNLDQYRDGARAMIFAQRACQLTKGREMESLCSLGCALAEAGRPEDGQRKLGDALLLARLVSDVKAASILNGYLETLRNGKPIRTTLYETNHHRIPR
jgi:tetratricopeptide (TPR) repeat protein